MKMHDRPYDCDDDEPITLRELPEMLWPAGVGILMAFALIWLFGCVGALKGGTPPPIFAPKPQTYNVACVVTEPSGAPVVGARCFSEGIQGYTNQDGYFLLEGIPAGRRVIVVSKDGYVTGSADYTADHNQDVAVTLAPKIVPLPPPPTRDEILNVHVTFQGLTVDCPPYGSMPAFEAVLAWASPACRQGYYAAKHASLAWGDGDTHAIVQLPFGPPLYDEPNQPYSADRFGALDWTASGTHIDGRLADLLHDVVTVGGFKSVLLFEGGDAGQAGFPIAMQQLDLLHDAIRGNNPYGDFGPFVILLPGWDGVFYGYTPDQVAQWGVKCRELFVYCGIEHQPGRIPVGEGGGDYVSGGRMSTFDLILAEFDGPQTSAWRQQNPSGTRGDYYGNQIWQIAARMLGPAFRRPADEPANADGGAPPYYLAPGTVRGPYQHCAFEWVGEYAFVRGQQTSADQQVARDYFKSIGYSCGG